MGEIKEDTLEQSRDLLRVVQVNEEIKKIIRISSEVNLVALNAMLTAKRAGEKSRGFGVVSSELRAFSGKLEHFMSDLGNLIYGLVHDVAAILKQVRMRRHFVNARKNSERSQQSVELVLARKQVELEKFGGMVRTDWDKLSLQIYRALQLCETGNSLSRSAKIEAVYGGDMTAALKQVANEIEATINQILSILKVLRSQMAE